mgnify:CR=1 FL=1
MIDQAVLEKIKPGATIKVFERVKDGDKERLSQFNGLVLARKHGSEQGASFTVRTTLAGVGVEKVFPVHSPKIAKVEVLSSPKKVKRAKLYYLRTRSKKEIRQHTQGRTQAVSASSEKAEVSKESEKAAE